ncbi:MAG TPA: hypothetical protein VFS05_07470 [Gemmatimonadaceae bacterium]|nr:hypothetical protein [Gemmatimonadaceae bacterium]
MSKLRGVADQLRGVSIPHQEWLAVDGVPDTARLVRAIAAIMPPSATVNVVRPRGEVEVVLRARAAHSSRPEAGDYYCRAGDPALAEVAAAMERQSPAAPCAGVFVMLSGHHVLEAFRRDAGEEVVWLATDLPDHIASRLRRALEGAPPERGPAAERSNGFAPRTDVLGDSPSA